MARFAQPKGERGSVKWIQLAVDQGARRHLDELILPKLDGAKSIKWQSPLVADASAEYRDGAFLEKMGAQHLTDALAAF